MRTCAASNSAAAAAAAAALIACMMATGTLAAPVDQGQFVTADFDPVQARAPEPTPGPSPAEVKRAVDKWTIVFTNMHDGPITTRHARAGDPKWKDPISGAGPFEAGEMEQGASKEFVVPNDWNGSWFVNAKGKKAGATSSQMEANSEKGKWAFNVSYVKGFSLPMICQCENGIKSGCTIDLFSKGQCPAMVEDACKNPNHENPADKFAVPFFEPCKGQAYTYVEDHDAIRFDQCHAGKMTCCVGKACSG